MIILGVTADDKGKQLETLVKTILASLGYSNIHVNVIGAGGSEADVTAQITVSKLSGESSSELICECKARKVPANMEDWQKFLGKVHLFNAGCPKQVLGCFISLRGYNGNVIGSYRQYRQTSESIDLVTEEEIVKLLSKKFTLIEESSLRSSLSKKTMRSVKSVELTYYEGSLLWFVQFADDAYTVLLSQGTKPAPSVVAKICPLLEGETTASAYIDLDKEEESFRRRQLILKTIMALLVSSKASISSNVLLKDVKIDALEMQECLSELLEKRLIRIEGDVILLEAWTTDLHIFCQVVKWWSTGPLPAQQITNFLCSDFYDSHFGEDLLLYISELQGNLPIPTERREEVLHILRMSPSSFGYATTPQQMFLQHRVINRVEGFDCDAFDIDMFFESLYESLERDFLNPVLQGYFYVKHGLRELEVNKQILVKGRSGVIREAKLGERVVIALVDESLGGAFVHLRGLPTSPQPWEGTDPDNESIEKAFRKVYLMPDEFGPVFYDPPNS